MTKLCREELAYPPAKKVPGDKGQRSFDTRETISMAYSNLDAAISEGRRVDKLVEIVV